MKKIFFNIFRISISIGILLFLFYTIRHQTKTVLEIIAHFPRVILLQAVMLHFFVMVFLGLRLHYLFRGQEIHLKKLECLRITLIGAFFNNFLPTGAGGDVVKGYLAAKQTQQVTRSIICILMDRMTGLIMIILLASLSGVILAKGPIHAPEAVLKVSYLFLILTFSFGALFFLLPITSMAKFAGSFPLKNLRPHLTKIFEALDVYRHQKYLFLKAIFLSFLAQMTFAGVTYLLIRGLGFTLPLFHLLVALPLVHISSMIPSINGLGVREGTVVYLLGNTLGMEKALVLALLSTGILVLWGLFAGGILYLLLLWKGIPNDSKGVTRNFSLSHLQRAG